MIIFVRRCPRQKLLCPFTFLLLLGILAFAASDPEQVRIFYFCYHNIHLNGSTLNHYQFAQFARTAHFYNWIFCENENSKNSSQVEEEPTSGASTEACFFHLLLFLFVSWNCVSRNRVSRNRVSKDCIFWKCIGELIVGSKHCKAYSAAASSELSELVVHVDVVYFG